MVEPTDKDISQENFCHIIEPSDSMSRRKYLYLKQLIPSQDTFSVDLIGEIIGQKLKEINNIESALWRIESFDDQICLYMHITVSNKNCRTTTNKLFNFFPNAAIMAIDQHGVKAVREFCARVTSENPEDVYSYGKINKFDYIEGHLVSDLTANTNTSLVVSPSTALVVNQNTSLIVSEAKFEIAKNKREEKIWLMRYFDDLKYWEDSVARETNPELRKKWEITYNHVKNMTLAQYKEWWVPEIELTPLQKRNKNIMEYNAREKERIACVRRFNKTGTKCGPQHETRECSNDTFRKWLERRRLDREEKERDKKKKTVITGIEWTKEELEVRKRERMKE